MSWQGTSERIGDDFDIAIEAAMTKAHSYG